MTPNSGFNDMFATSFESVEVAKPPFKVALCKGVDEQAAKDKLKECSPDINPDEAIVSANGLEDADFLKKLADGEFGKVYAVLGRTKLDTAIIGLMKADPEFLNKLKRYVGVNFIGKLGNGVSFDTQSAFEKGIISVRTPRANAETVTIWTNLLLDAMEAKNLTDLEFMQANPAAEDNALVKNLGDPSKKLKWDRNKISKTSNPDLLDREDETLLQDTKSLAEEWRGKTVAVLGAGMIGRMDIEKNPRLAYANVVYYDTNKMIDIPGAKKAESIAEAVTGADLVLVHVAGKEQVIKEKELALMKKGAMIVNTARGEVISPKDLYESIENGQISKLGTDVHFDENNIGKATAEFVKDGKFSLDNIPRSEWKDIHYAVALRMHENVIATNHSAASEINGQRKNAMDGIDAAYKYWDKGQVVNGFVASPDAHFPYGGLIQDASESDSPAPIKYDGKRLAIEIIHDGKVAGILQKVYNKIEAVLKSMELMPQNDLLNKFGGSLKRKEVQGKVNSIDFNVFGIDTNGGLTPEVLIAIKDTIERVFEAVYGIRIWQVSEKPSAEA